MPVQGRITGTRADLTLDGNRVHITKVGAKSTKNMDDTTDTGDIDPTTGLLHESQVPHSLVTELSVEGNWRSTSPTTNAVLLQKCYQGTAVLVGTLKIDGTNTNYSGQWDITDFEADIPAAGKVSFKATLKGNGVIAVS